MAWREPTFLTRRLEIFKATKALQPSVACDILPSKIGKVSLLEAQHTAAIVVVVAR